MAMAIVAVNNIIINQTASSLQGFHAGSDQTGRFANKGKFTCWKIFASASEDVVQAFVYVGSQSLPSRETELNLVKYVCQVYEPTSSHTGVLQIRLESRFTSKIGITFAKTNKSYLSQKYT